MGLTKQYLKYVDAGVFGVIASGHCNVLHVGEDSVLVAGCELVFIWNVRTQDKVSRISMLKTFYGEKVNATQLTLSHDGKKLAVGYANGVIHVFDLDTGVDPELTFKGHKSAVTVLNYDHDDMRLVSASKDTNIIMWDIVNECGVFRLKGHKSEVTQVKFIQGHNVLVSSSKDTFIKFWDLDTQHCFKTLVDNRTEVWDLLIMKANADSAHLITGSGDNLLRVFLLTFPLKGDTNTVNDIESEDESEKIDAKHVGNLKRKGQGRTVALRSHGDTFACLGTDSLVEMFRFADKTSESSKAKSLSGDMLNGAVHGLSSLNFSNKLSNFDLYEHTAAPSEQQQQQQQTKDTCVVGLLSNNRLEFMGLANPKQIVESLNREGHAGEVRTVAFSSDSTAIMTGGGRSVKVWNRATSRCIRTMACEYPLCGTFAPGDRHLIVGSKSGKIQIFDVASSSLLETIEAHDSSIWSLCLSPNKKEVVTGSADHKIKFWQFELIKDVAYSTIRKRLSLSNTRTLKMSDDVLYVKYSPDQKFLAASLLDSTIKVFYADTLKFFLSLYGHKLPVLCFDISTDGTILASASSDRNIRLWGLDFGDCHKSIFAHDESILSLQFIPKTHMFFSCSRDNNIKQWDADNYENIITLKGHQSIVWTLAVSPSGNFMVSASNDHSLRMWEKTAEIVILHDQREIEREEEYESTILDQPVIVGETNKETAIAGIQTITTVRAAEKLLEALLLEETDGHLYVGNNKPEQLHPMLRVYNVDHPAAYVLAVLREVKASELEEVLLVLPYTQVVQLLKLCRKYLKKRLHTELVVKTCVFLLKIHEGKLTSSAELLECLESIGKYKRLALLDMRDTIGFNMAALNHIRAHLTANKEVDAFRETKEIELKMKSVLT